MRRFRTRRWQIPRDTRDGGAGQATAMVLRARTTPSSDRRPRTAERPTNNPLEPMDRQVTGGPQPEPEDASNNDATPLAYRRWRGDEHGPSSRSRRGCTRATRRRHLAMSCVLQGRSPPAPTGSSPGLLHQLVQATCLPMASTPSPRHPHPEAARASAHVRTDACGALGRRFHVASTETPTRQAAPSAHRLRRVRRSRQGVRSPHGPHQVLRTRHAPRSRTSDRHRVPLLCRTARRPRRTDRHDPRTPRPSSAAPAQLK